MGNGVLGMMRLYPWEEGEREGKRERENPDSEDGEKKMSLVGVFFQDKTCRFG